MLEQTSALPAGHSSLGYPGFVLQPTDSPVSLEQLALEVHLICAMLTFLENILMRLRPASSGRRHAGRALLPLPQSFNDNLRTRLRSQHLANLASTTRESHFGLSQQSLLPQNTQSICSDRASVSLQLKDIKVIGGGIKQSSSQCPLSRPASLYWYSVNHTFLRRTSGHSVLHYVIAALMFATLVAAHPDDVPRTTSKVSFSQASLISPEVRFFATGGIGYAFWGLLPTQWQQRTLLRPQSRRCHVSLAVLLGSLAALLLILDNWLGQVQDNHHAVQYMYVSAHLFSSHELTNWF
jgi:hypothetical protein